MHNSLTCFGVGNGWPCADRGHASFLYRVGRQSLLIDCGESVDSRFEASGLKRDSFNALFLSHLHADHFGGLFMFLQGCWLKGRRKALPVYLPASGVRPIRDMLRAAFLFDELFRFKFSLNALRSGKPVRVGNARVTAFPTTHLDVFRRRFARKYRVGFESYAFMIESPGTRIVHSADIGEPEDLEPALEGRTDLLVCELAHFESARLFDFLKRKNIGQIVFVHLSDQAWANLERTRRLASRRLGNIPHTFAMDGSVIRF